MAGRRDGTNDASGAALIAFLNDAMQRGILPPQTGANYVVACKDILPFVLGENWARTDMTTLEMDELRRRLTATKGDRQLSRFNEQFMPAVDAFRNHLGLAPFSERITIPTDPFPNPVPGAEKNGEVPKHRTAPARRRRLPIPSSPPTTPADPVPVPSPRDLKKGDGTRTSRGTRTRRVEPTLSETPPPTPDTSEVPIVASSPALNSAVIPHLFPLRDGMLATLLLPADLTVREAKRLTAFIESLALSDGPDISDVGAYPDANGSVATPESQEARSPHKQPAVIPS